MECLRDASPARERGPSKEVPGFEEKAEAPDICKYLRGLTVCLHVERLTS